jgi:Protein of unknown function, DUF481
MKPTLLSVLRHTALAFVLSTAALAADRIEMTDGSVVMGKLLSAEGGKFKVETAFAGTIEIAQDKIKNFSTDEAVNVGLSAGSAVLGKVEATGSDLTITAGNGQMTATPDKVVAVWRAGADSPETVAAKAAAAKAERKWAYEAGLALTGRIGTTDKFSSLLGFKATLESSHDKLIFSLLAEKSDDNGVETANRQLGSVDYSSFFNDKTVWYVRTSMEKDAIKALDYRSSTAFGVGRKVIKKDVQDLELRVGLNYLYESYTNGVTFDSPGLEMSLIHVYHFETSQMNNVLYYNPAFSDFGNYRFHHESTFETPIAASQWKIKLGLSNDYMSQPQPGIDKWDTLYFTSLILNWK